MIAWEIAALLTALTKIAAGSKEVQIRNISYGKVIRVVDTER